MDDRFSGRGLRALVLAAAALLLLLRLGNLDLWAPDEPRYAQIAEEVRALERGPSGLFLLSLNGEAYTQKPPLYYWLAALAGASDGRVSEADARLPSAVAGIALVALVLGFGSPLLGRATALFGAGFLATAWLFAHLGRRAQLDVLLGLFEALALVGFWRLDRGIGSRSANLVLLHACMGLGVLTKGPVGFVVPALVIVAFLAWEGRLRTIGSFFPARGLALSVLPGLAWITIATLLAPAGFLEEAVVDNLYGRFLLGTSKANPWYYFIPVFPADFLPWSLLWPVVYVIGRRQIFAVGAAEEPRRAWRFLLAWCGATFVFFSISSGKRDLYLIPCYPAAALLTGDAAIRALRSRSALPRWVGRLVGGLGVTIVAALLVIVVAQLIPNVRMPLAFVGVVAAVILAAWWSWPRAPAHLGALGQLGVLIAAVFALELATFTLMLPALEPEKSPQPVARAAAALAPGGEPIGLVEMQPGIGGIAYYSGRRVEDIAPAAELRTFFEKGGRVAIIRAETFERVHGEAFSEIRARFRAGRRALLVVTPAPGLARSETAASGRD